MEYRELGKTKEKVSVLGFGAMRLPTLGSNDKVNEKEAEKIITYGIDNGINIIDTAYSYHTADLGNGAGNSERILGEILEKGFREKVLISTKSPSWLVEKESDFNKFLDYQLNVMNLDYIDIYLLHNINKSNWERLKNLNALDFLDQAKEDGKIKHIGFSSHTSFDSLMEIVSDYDKWEVGLTQMNYIDEQYQSGIDGLNYLSSIDIGTMVMEPLRGGKLVESIPESVEKIWGKAEIKRSPLEWAFKYLWNMDSVDCVLSGMNNLEHVKENIKIASNSNVGCLNENESNLIREVAREYRSLKGNDCTSCSYCMPCPEKIDIPNCFNEYNIAKMLNNPEASAMQYFSLIDEESRADKCIDCKKCIPFCPQMINIPEELKKVSKLFGKEFKHSYK